MTTFSALAKEKYVLVTTFRKNGTGVATPVWAAADGEALVVWTPTDSWKVKRIRRDSRVTVSPCDMRGKSSGPVIDGVAEIQDADATERTRSLIAKKYGIMGHLAIAGSKLRRGSAGTIGIRIVPA